LFAVALGFFKDEYLPTRRGFESHYGYYQGCGGYYDHTYAGTWPNDVIIVAVVPLQWRRLYSKS
jgi:hypothetical protein